jgi:hypothetical protein
MPEGKEKRSVRQTKKMDALSASIDAPDSIDIDEYGHNSLMPLIMNQLYSFPLAELLHRCTVC